MTQLELNRAVARATGESWRTIADRGFNLVDVSEPVTDADFEALTVDWDKELSAIARDGWIDFLSLDLEPPNLTIAILLRLPLHKIRFRCACVEHDYYRDEEGITRATIAHEVMASNGYRKVRSINMFYNNEPKSIYLEDWWVDKASDVTEQDVQYMIETCLSVAT